MNNFPDIPVDAQNNAALRNRLVGLAANTNQPNNAPERRVEDISAMIGIFMSSGSS